MKFAKMLSALILKNVYVNDQFWVKRSYRTPPQSFFILMNENQFSTSIKINWTKMHFYKLISLACFYKWSHSPANKCMPKVNFHHTKRIKIYLDLVSCSSWNHCSVCKLVVERLSFNMLYACVIHQIIKIFIQGLSSSWWVQNLLFQIL